MVNSILSAFFGYAMGMVCGVGLFMIWHRPLSQKEFKSWSAYYDYHRLKIGRELAEKITDEAKRVPLLAELDQKLVDMEKQRRKT